MGRRRNADDYAEFSLGIRLRPSQSFLIQYVVTALLALYVALVLLVFLPTLASVRDAGWCARQRWFAVFEGLISTWCLWAATLIHPGEIPRGWNGSNANPDDADLAWCQHCEEWKPVRAHHCKQCGVCVPRYDHHCDWIDNCVGQRNHKTFFLFLLYVALCVVHYFFMLVQFGANIARRPYVPMSEFAGEELLPRASLDVSTPVLLFVILYTVVAFGLLIFSCAFLSCTAGHVASNMTQYDETVGVEGDSGFSRGFLANAAEVLGPHPLLWLVPSAMPLVITLSDAGDAGDEDGCSSGDEGHGRRKRGDETGGEGSSGVLGYLGLTKKKGSGLAREKQE